MMRSCMGRAVARSTGRGGYPDILKPMPKVLVSMEQSLLTRLDRAAGRQLRWTVDELRELADQIQKSGFDVLEPDLARVATWVARGLTAYDASYVALAEQLAVPLATGNRLILELAPRVAVPPERTG